MNHITGDWQFKARFDIVRQCNIRTMEAHRYYQKVDDDDEIEFFNRKKCFTWGQNQRNKKVAAPSVCTLCRTQCDQIWARFHKVGNTLNVFGNCLTVCWLFGKMLSPIWTIWMLLGAFSLWQMGKYWKIYKTSGHTAYFAKSKEGVFLWKSNKGLAMF